MDMSMHAAPTRGSALQARSTFHWVNGGLLRIRNIWRASAVLELLPLYQHLPLVLLVANMLPQRAHR